MPIEWLLVIILYNEPFGMLLKDVYPTREQCEVRKAATILEGHKAGTLEIKGYCVAREKQEVA